MLHGMLWRANQDLVRECLEHPFVRALGDGSLEPRLFAAYVAQDAFFLRAFIQAYALALARSAKAETISAFRELLNGAVDELRLHSSYAAELGLHLDQVIPNPACRAYTDFLLHTAWHASLGETMAAMTPCMRLYAYLGGELAKKLRPQHPYQRWIETYSGKEFQELAAHMERLLDRLAADTREVRDHYRYAMQCERDFFFDALEAST